MEDSVNTPRESFVPPTHTSQPGRPERSSQTAKTRLPHSDPEIEAQKSSSANIMPAPQGPLATPTTSLSRLHSTQSPRLGSPGFQRMNIEVSFCDASTEMWTLVRPCDTTS